MKQQGWSCPVPQPGDRVLLAHGGGGKLMHQLLDSVFLPRLGNPFLRNQHDAAQLEINSSRVALTTDSYVVSPIFFPGGNIGDLAVNGTVNDLAMCGARPMYLSAAFILEEGLPISTLETIVDSMAEAAQRAGIQLVTADTKVVDRNKADKLFITTTGVGIVESTNPIAPEQVRPGDAIILSGDIGRHAITIMCAREGLEFDTTVESDTAPLWKPVEALLGAGLSIHCLRDLTRGGLASATNEIARHRQLGLVLEEAAIPLLPPVQAACEVLGLDPLYLACEGRFIALLPSEQATEALQILRSFDICQNATLAGYVVEDHPGTVVLRSRVGAQRIVDMLSGEELPRIC